MVSSGRLGIEAPRRESLEFRFIELVSVAYPPSTGDNSCHTIIAVRMRGDLRMRGHAQHDGIDASFIRVTLEHYGLYPADARTSCARIALLREFELPRSEPCFAYIPPTGGCELKSM